MRDEQGHRHIKPEIAAKLPPRLLTRAEALLVKDRASEANSIAGCRHIQNVTSFCASNHEAEHAPVVCGKPLLDEACATPKARLAKFQYESPDLYAHLMGGKFQVLTLTIHHDTERTPERLHKNTTEGRVYFAKFIAGFKGRHGWKWLPGFSEDFHDTVFYAIHVGSSLAPQPMLQEWWRYRAGRSATLRIKTFDGKDGDKQKDGLLLAHSGFVNYWRKVLQSENMPELEISQAFRDEDLSVLYGYFRGFTLGTEPDPDPFVPICTVCGKPHIRQHMLMTIEELSGRFDHIRPPSYGQRRRRLYNNPPTLPISDAASPPG
jgi:hypothetical protein